MKKEVGVVRKSISLNQELFLKIEELRRKHHGTSWSKITADALEELLKKEEKQR